MLPKTLVPGVDSGVRGTGRLRGMLRKSGVEGGADEVGVRTWVVLVRIGGSEGRGTDSYVACEDQIPVSVEIERCVYGLHRNGRNNV